jgi:hypothetical protein
MPIDVQQVGIVAKVGYHVGIPNLGQLRARMHESASPSMPAASRNDQALARSPLTTWRRSPCRNLADACHPNLLVRQGRPSLSERAATRRNKPLAVLP